MDRTNQASLYLQPKVANLDAMITVGNHSCDFVARTTFSRSAAQGHCRFAQVSQRQSYTGSRVNSKKRELDAIATVQNVR
jgi:hypothetical protein